MDSTEKQDGMDSTEKQDGGLYGSNITTGNPKDVEGIREQTTKHPEKGNEEAFDAIRRDAADDADNHGGMGREETPRDGKSQGEWHQEDQVGADRPNI